MSRRVLVAPVVMIAALLTACGGSSARRVLSTPTIEPPADITVPANGQITIGISASLIGDQAGLGRDIADAAELAMADAGGAIKGHKLVALRVDDGCDDAEKAVAAARRFVAEDGLAGVIGPMCTTGVQAADKTYSDAHIVHISPTATRIGLATQDGPYFFRTSWQDDAEARVQAAYLRETANAATAIVVDDGQPYGKGLADAFTTAFEAAGGRVVSRERIARGTTDFTTLARQVKSANPAALVFEGLNPEGVLLAKALDENSYAGLFVGPDALLRVREFIVAGAAATDGAIISGGPMPDEAFVAKFRNRFQREPSTSFVLEAYDATTALVKALDATAKPTPDGGLTVGRSALAATLHGQRFAGLTGTVAFDDNGDRAGDRPHDLGLEIYRVVNGKFEPIR